MPSFFQPIIGSSFDAIAAQRMGYNQLDTQIQSGNLARQAQAQEAVNNWLSQASQLRQRAMDTDAASQQRADEMAAAERATLRDYAFRKGEQAAQIAAEDRRTKAQVKKADDQLQQQKEIIEADQKSRADRATQDILDAGQTFAAQYPGSKRNFESAQDQYHALEAEQDKLEAENKSLAQAAGKTIFGSAKKMSEESQATVQQNTKRLKEIQHLLSPRGDAAKQFDIYEKEHQKLVDKMSALGFIPDDQNGTIFHGPTKQKFPFNTTSVRAAAGDGASLMSPIMAGPNATMAALASAPATAPADPGSRWTFDPASGTVKPNTATATAPPSAPASAPAAPPPPIVSAPIPASLPSMAESRIAARRLRARDAQVGPRVTPTVAPTLAPVTNAPVISPPPAPLVAAPPATPPAQTNAPVIAGPRSVISNRQMAAAQKGIPAANLERRELSKLSGLPSQQLLALARRFGMDLRYTGVDSFTTADASKIYGKDELVQAVERLAQQNDVAL